MKEDRQTDMYKTKIDNLDLKQIADSGQCFRWKNTGENEYTVVAFDRALRIKQDGNEFELDEFEGARQRVARLMDNHNV